MCGDLLSFSSLKTPQKSQVHSDRFLLADLQENRLAKQWAEEKETGDSSLARKRYKVLSRLLVTEDKRKNSNPRMSGISNNKHKQHLEY